MRIETRTAKHSKALNGQKDTLIDDIRLVMTDVDDLLQKARTSSAEGYSAVRKELEDRLSNSIVRLQEIQEELKSRARQTVRATDNYVHDNPWKSMGYVAVAGVILGLFLTRRR